LELHLHSAGIRLHPRRRERALRTRCSGARAAAGLGAS
jgi:hypothetical protein